MRLRAGQRLRRNDDFGAVRKKGRRIDCEAFMLTWCQRPTAAATSQPRVGVVASRAAVGDAVNRNRAKRRLRSLYRLHQQLVPPGVDVILTARASLLRIEFAEAARRFTQACTKIQSHG